MKKIFPDLPGWSFDMDEVSAGVYEIIGRNVAGYCVSAKGINLDTLIEECRDKAFGVSSGRVGEKNKP